MNLNLLLSLKHLSPDSFFFFLGFCFSLFQFSRRPFDAKKEEKKKQQKLLLFFFSSPEHVSQASE